jgi:hypothetical protein
MKPRCSGSGATNPSHVLPLDVNAIAEGRLSRALLAEVASFLHYPAMASTSRLAYLLKAVEGALRLRT